LSSSDGAGLELTILMPCLNEVETLKPCITKAKAFLVRAQVNGEVVIADNGSTDGSQALAESLGARVVPVPERGYGAALFEGSRQARGRYIVMGDSDDSYDFSAIDPFLERLRAGDDLVMGNRFRGGIRPGAMPWKNRYIGNPVLSGVGTMLFRTGVRDFHCGMRGFSKKAFERMDLRTLGMEFASEMVIKATLMGMTITEVPTTLDKDGRSRPPHLRPWRDGWRHLRFMMLYSPRWLFLYPGLFLMLLGSVMVALLYRGPLFLGEVGFDVHTMLYGAVAILVGFQGVLFSAFSRIFATVERLVPESPALNRMFRFITLETGLIAGVVLLIVGVGATLFALQDWNHEAFGPLDARHTLRKVIPAVLALTLGAEVLMGSLFLSMLGLRIRRAGDGS
jgi:glycosyltransferase involved in cell wall biosynthesis